MAYRTIILRGEGIRKERVAAGTIQPGMLVELTSADKVQAQSNSTTTPVQKAVAVEDDMWGKGVSDNYSADALVQYNLMQTGEEVAALIAASQTIPIGMALESDGAGALIPRSSGLVWGYALEAKVTTTADLAAVEVA